MAIAFRSASGDETNGGILHIPQPSGVQSGDVLIAQIFSADHNDDIEPADDWTLIRNVQNSAAGATCQLNVYWRVAGSSEPAIYDFDIGVSNAGAGGILAFTGVDTSNPIDVENGQAVADPGAALTYATPSITTTVANTMLVAAVGYEAAYSVSPPGGMTEAWDRTNTAPDNAAGHGGAGAYVLQAGTGATGAKTFTASANLGADPGCTHILALRPSTDTSLTPTSIASGEAFGGDSVNFSMLATAIASAEAFGSAFLEGRVQAVAIASAEAFGAPGLTVYVVTTAIPSAEAVGAPHLIIYIEAAGIASEEVIGSLLGVFVALPRGMDFHIEATPDLDFVRASEWQR